MPPKKRPPAPIDRPLSKAYLREFAGWSTAYPPGLSEPNSIRVMENVQVTRDGAARVRPGMQSYLRTKSPLPIVGSHELFYLPTGKAYLIAVRETVDVGTDDEREIVGFRVIGPDGNGGVTMGTLAEFGFVVPAEPNALSFTGATTYVKYLQIDNKIFALSNAPEGMLMFWVGTEKKAKKLQSIVRPDWTIADKLTAMQPASAWVLGNIPSATRQNLCRNPDFEVGTSRWAAGNSSTGMYQTGTSSVGSYGLRAWSEPVRENYATSPLHDVASTGTFGWEAEDGAGTNTVVGDAMRFTTPDSNVAKTLSLLLSVPSGESMRIGYDLVGTSNLARLDVGVRLYDQNETYLYTAVAGENASRTPGRHVTPAFTIPAQAAYARIRFKITPAPGGSVGSVTLKNICFSRESDTSNQAPLSGDDGAGYYWRGTPNNSRSVFHPAQDIWLQYDLLPITPGAYAVSADIRGTTGKQVEIEARARDAAGVTLQLERTTSTGTDAYVRLGRTITAPAGTSHLDVRIVMRAAGRSDELRLDAVLIEKAATVGAYFSGNTASSPTEKRRWSGAANDSISVEEIFSPTAPTAQTPTVDTLVSSDATKNRYSFSFFYTVSNELGEAAASQVTTIKAQRPWTTWQWLDPNGADTDNPLLCHDQLTVTMPQEVFDAAVAAGATHWTAYYYYQGPNDAPSVTAMRFAEIRLDSEPDHDQHGYARLTPQMVKIGIGDPLIPSESTRFNASNPVKGSQGIVAADRLILVGNPADPARISWSSGAPGDYFNFSTLLGGGTKQLTSGNLYVTSCVKLWQNPQSVDTLTVLNSGDDGRSNAYYMQPAQITSLSESISVMGFEEITSMEGTVAPYGCEVVNNGLYRPLFHGLFKSTANNYNLSTRSVTDSIQNMWRSLQTPRRIVSSQLDSRIYYLVHNIYGEPLQANCMGNEVWVIDLVAKTPTWSRWKVQGVSLRAMDTGGVVMMSIVRPDGIFLFNEDLYTDERFNATTGELEVVNIPWYLETNVQGANRAHDAWCNLQQANVMVGNFLGQMRYGIRGQDVNGMPIELEKVVLSDNPPPSDMHSGSSTDGQLKPTLEPTEREDYLLVRKVMKEWVFFAGSVNDTADNVVTPRFSGGQVSSVQYRYTPSTVNVGYEYGSVETFEYGQSYAIDATTDSGTPQPYTDLSRA